MAEDPDYRDNQKRAQKQWRDSHPDYWRDYRAANPEYAQQNRERQRDRNALRRLPTEAIAKMYEQSGLIVDVKNNLSAKVRSMAAYHGRENDIVELGNRPTATPVNIINGLDKEEVKKIFETSDHYREGNVEYFDKEGVKIIGDFIDIIYALSAKDMSFTPSLGLLAMLVADIDFARKVFEYYREKAYNHGDFDQMSMVSRVESEAFHPLNAKHEREERYHQQVSWNLGRIRQMLAGFSAQPYSSNFSQAANRSFVLDFQELLYRQNKIVLLRFDAATSSGGRVLAKMAKAKLYTDIYRTDPEDVPSGKYTFQVIDEFQDAFEPDGAVGDLAWFAKSREFRHINVISCQSLSSLYRGAKAEAVHELVTNCSAKFCLQTEDVATVSYFDKYSPAKRLVDLVGSEAFFCKFDLDRRGMVTALVDVAEIYANMTDHLDNLARMVVPQAAPEEMDGIATQVREIRITIGFIEKTADNEKPAEPDPEGKEGDSDSYNYDDSNLLSFFEERESKSEDRWDRFYKCKAEEYKEEWLSALTPEQRYALLWKMLPPTAPPVSNPESMPLALVVTVEKVDESDIDTGALTAECPVTDKKQ